MHNFRVYWISLYMFRMVFPSIIRSPRLYIQHQVYVTQVCWLLASWNKILSLLASSQNNCVTYTWCCMYSLGLWWWTERPSETCRAIFNKLENCASSWFYYRNISKQCLLVRPCCLVQMCIYQYKTSCTTTRTDSRYHKHYYINYKHHPPPKKVIHCQCLKLLFV